MQVAAVGSNAAASDSAPTSSSAASSPTTVDYTTFLTILMAELKNQDPTKPADPTQMVSQMASFSQVEQQIKSNSKLDALLSSMEIAQAGSLIGHTAASADGTVSGAVTAVKVVSGGSVAILDNGKELPLNAGIRIS
jgi:flagellar basal-body rod modification protein FlgD